MNDIIENKKRYRPLLEQKRISVLIVEDQAIISLSTARKLQNRNFAVSSAYCSSSALKVLENCEVDIVLMDINLGVGEVDGIETARIIRERHKLPVVFFSSHCDETVIEQARSISDYGYIHKSAHEITIAAALKTAMEMHRLRSLHNRNKKCDTFRELLHACYSLSPDLSHPLTELNHILSIEGCCLYSFETSAESPSSARLIGKKFLHEQVDEDMFSDRISFREEKWKHLPDRLNRGTLVPILDSCHAIPLAVGSDPQGFLVVFLNSFDREILDDNCTLQNILVPLSLFLQNLRKIEAVLDTLPVLLHDIKNPLSAVIGYSSLLVEKHQEDKVLARYLYLMQSAGKTILLYLNSASALFNILNGTYRSRKTLIDIISFTNTLASYLQLEEIEGNKAFSIRTKGLDDGSEILIESDELLLTSIIGNLLKNAMEARYCDETVHIEIEKNEARCEFSIKNRKPLPDHLLSTFFDKYKTFDKPEGSGLGTYIIKKMSERMNLNVKVHSAPSVGTRITLTFDVCRTGDRNNEKV